MADDFDDIPDARDGLTRIERVILLELHRAQRESGRDQVPSAIVYGRVCEHIPIAPQDFERLLAKLSGRGLP